MDFFSILTIHKSRVQQNLEALSSQFGDRLHCRVHSRDTSINHNWSRQTDTKSFSLTLKTKTIIPGTFQYWHSTLGLEIMSSTSILGAGLWTTTALGMMTQYISILAPSSVECKAMHMHFGKIHFQEIHSGQIHFQEIHVGHLMYFYPCTQATKC